MAMIINELSVAQGFGSIQKVFNMKANEAILFGMVCELSIDAGVVTIKKGYSGTGMAYVAQNSYTNADADATMYPNSSIGDGVHTQIVAIPVVAPVEVEIPAARFAATPAVGDELEAGSNGLWAVAAGAGTVIGTITEATTDGFLVLLEKTVRAA